MPWQNPAGQLQRENRGRVTPQGDPQATEPAASRRQSSQGWILSLAATTTLTWKAQGCQLTATSSAHAQKYNSSMHLKSTCLPPPVPHQFPFPSSRNMGAVGAAPEAGRQGLRPQVLQRARCSQPAQAPRVEAGSHAHTRWVSWPAGVALPGLPGSEPGVRSSLRVSRGQPCPGAQRGPESA